MLFNNSFIFISPEGNTLSEYNKIHLFPLTGEPDIFEAGICPTSVKIEDTKIGFATCYDLRFPEQFRYYAEKGVEKEGFVIITTEPNSLMEKIHNRMPVILKKEDEDEAERRKKQAQKDREASAAQKAREEAEKETEKKLLKEKEKLHLPIEYLEYSMFSSGPKFGLTFSPVKNIFLQLILLYLLL